MTKDIETKIAGFKRLCVTTATAAIGDLHDEMAGAPYFETTAEHSKGLITVTLTRRGHKAVEFMASTNTQYLHTAYVSVDGRYDRLNWMNDYYEVYLDEGTAANDTVAAMSAVVASAVRSIMREEDF